MLLALQNGLAVFAQNDQLSTLKSSAPEDLELICTGSEMKWISLSQSHTLGQLVFVDFEGDSTTDYSMDVACPDGLLSDKPSFMGTPNVDLAAHFVAYAHYIIQLYQRPYTLFAYLTAQPRSPPRFLL